MKTEEVIQLLKQEWHVQGFIATPLYLCTCANSGVFMGKYLEVQYSAFLYFFKMDYCEMHYSVGDLKRIWAVMEQRYKKDKNYFQQLRKRFQDQADGYDSLKQAIATEDLTAMDEDAFLDMFRKTLDMLENMAGMAHMIESFSMLHGSTLRDKLAALITDQKKLNNCFKLLSQPVTASRITDNEIQLYKISLITDAEQQKAALQKHAKKFFWVRNNYLHATPLVLDDFSEELKTLKQHDPLDYEKIIAEKNAMIQELGLDAATQELITLIEFFVDFQDERKSRILMAVSSLEKMAYELCRCYNIPHELVKYLVKEDATKEFITQKNLLAILEERRKGCLVVALPEGNTVIVGPEFEKIERAKKESKRSETEDIHGMTASSGTATGPVKVCLSPDALEQVEEGAVLVAPMTRPEFVPAMKKACAVVTDEGGITCHAAIVSRELGIPCIIGTKNATKVLKDGDIVQVSSHHGVVKVLKKA